MKTLSTPFDNNALLELTAGDEVELNGKIYVARDAAHKKFVSALTNGKNLSFDIKGALIYYMGPTPTPPGKVIGSCGPTTSTRMDSMTIPLLERGLKATMGKGKRNQSVIKACKKYKAVYLITFGGCGAYLNQFVRKNRIIAYPELGPEAVRELTVHRFPAIVGIDVYGNDFYQIVSKGIIGSTSK